MIAGACFSFQSQSLFGQTQEQRKEKKKEARANKCILAYFGILKPVWTPGVRPRVGLLLALHRCRRLVPICWLAAYPHGSRRRYCQVPESANVEARKRIRLRAEAWFLASLDDACLHALADPWPEPSGFLGLGAQAFFRHCVEVHELVKVARQTLLGDIFGRLTREESLLHSYLGGTSDAYSFRVVQLEPGLHR